MAQVIEKTGMDPSGTAGSGSLSSITQALLHSPPTTDLMALLPFVPFVYWPHSVLLRKTFSLWLGLWPQVSSLRLGISKEQKTYILGAPKKVPEYLTFSHMPIPGPIMMPRRLESMMDLNHGPIPQLKGKQWGQLHLAQLTRCFSKG